MSKATFRLKYGILVVVLVTAAAVTCAWFRPCPAGLGNQDRGQALNRLSFWSFQLAQTALDEGIGKPEPLRTEEDRNKEVDEILKAIKDKGDVTEIRSYQNKMMAREMLRLVKALVIMMVIVVAVSTVIALSIWMYTRRRAALGLAVSPELAETLVAVEERQAKLANVLREIQGEIDYLHTMSAPDLKKLIEQAEKYLEQNDQDLEKTGHLTPGSSGRDEDPTTGSSA